MTTWLMVIIIILLVAILIVPIYFLLRIYFKDVNQQQHSILRNYPVLGKVRYILEKAGTELRQYLFENDNEGKPFNRREFQFVYIAAKYNSRMIGYGSDRDFEKANYYIVNDMFPKQDTE